MNISVCVWAQDYDEDSVYDTSCDNRHEFITGGVTENNYVFCPYCGKKIKEMPK
jgi:hypothetical protein